MMKPASYLESNGWHESPNRLRKWARCFYRRFATPTRCACNRDKHGIQICVAVSQYNGVHAYEIELHGELPDGTWVNLHNHGMPDDIEEGIKTIPRLLATWEFVANHHQPKP